MAISLLRYHQEATVSHLFDFCEEKALPPAGCLSRAPPALHTITRSRSLAPVSADQEIDFPRRCAS